jgi:hypothetical protein
MNRVVLSAVLLTFVGMSVPAAAEEAASPKRAARALVEVSELPPLAGDTDWSLPPVHLGGPKRGALLPTLYVGYAALNAFDAFSTSKGMANGAAEGNPLMGGVARHPAALWAVKGGVTAGSIAMAERLWREDKRKAAVAVMVIANGMMAVVAARNASVLRQIR